MATKGNKMELHEFVGARNNEDEKAATSAMETTGGRKWWAEKHYGDIFAMDLRTTDTHADIYFEATVDENGNLSPDSYDYFHGYVAEHISRFAPARILAEVAAKRVVLRKRAKCIRDMRGRSQWDEERWALEGTVRDLDEVLRAFAAAHSDHPDYNKNWMVK